MKEKIVRKAVEEEKPEMSKMLVYQIQCIPDLTLSKYQAFAASGVEGMLKAQTQFIRQMQRVAELGKISIHFIYEYVPTRQKGTRLAIYLLFGGIDGACSQEKMCKLIKASVIYDYFKLKEVEDFSFHSPSFCSQSVLVKKIRMIDDDPTDKKGNFFFVPNWAIARDARLYQLYKLMESMNEACCYCVDLYTMPDCHKQMHDNIQEILAELKKRIDHFSRREPGRRQYNSNMEEALRQCTDWLKAVEASSVFQCKISAFSDDCLTGQLLLNAVIPESIEKGSASIYNSQGVFNVFSEIQRLPQNCCPEEIINRARNWITSFTAEEISNFCRLPVLYDGETIEIPKETSVLTEEDGILLGTDSNQLDVHIPLSLLTKHMFICGVSGSGKTNTLLHLANSLWNDSHKDEDGGDEIHIPFLVLEPAKREYRKLALFNLPELLIFSPGAGSDFPLGINPFEFAEGLTLSEHIGNLCMVFQGAFPLRTPTPFILDRAIQAVYEKAGWKANDVNNGQKPYPCISDLYQQIEKEINNTSYDKEVKGNIRAILETRIGSLLQREKKDIFDVKKSTLSPEEWLQNPAIIELEALGEEQANFLTLLLCTLIREVLKAKPSFDGKIPVRHVIIIEEAHNLIAEKTAVSDPMDSNPKIAATKFIVKMLAEVRALGEGMIIADQLPTAMAPEVIKNTNIKLMHRLTALDDRKLMGSTMSASALQLEMSAGFTGGQALCTYEKRLRPFVMRVIRIDEEKNRDISDTELLHLMLEKPGYQQLYKKRKALEQMKFDSIKKQYKQFGEQLNYAMTKYLPEALNESDPKKRDDFRKRDERIFDMICAQGKSIRCEIDSLSPELIDGEDIQKIKQMFEIIDTNRLKR